MSMIVPPCGVRCDRREVGCHGSCEAWARYEAQRNAEYERVAKAVQDTNIVEAGKWRSLEQECGGKSERSGDGEGLQGNRQGHEMPWISV